MKKLVLTLFSFLLLMGARAQTLQVGGYLKYLPSQTFVNKGVLPPFAGELFPESFDDHLIHNRLNINAEMGQETRWTFEAGIRNRVFWGYQAQTEAFRSGLEADPGLIDMRWLWNREGEVLFHAEIDRLNFTYQSTDFTIRVGRQRINWGIHNVFNPNDIFNQYNYFDFDYEERPGADAVYAQYYLNDGFSSFDVAVSPNFENPDQSTAALLYKSNYRGYDWQVLAGYTYYDVVVGGGWAGSIGGAGFKGEGAYYHSTDTALSESNFTATLGLDYMFNNGIYASVSYLYNGLGALEPSILDQLSLRQTRLSSKNIFPYRHTVMLSTSYTLSMLWSIDLAWFQSHNFDQAAFVPGVRYSISNNWDAMLLAQMFSVRTENDKIAMFTSAIYARVKWSF